MKMQPLLIALALAAGTAFAQAPGGSEKPPTDAPAAATSTHDAAPAAKVHKKKTAQKKATKKGERHAKARHHGTRTMGAGAASPVTDLDAAGRQQRMDQAYRDWQARR